MPTRFLSVLSLLVLFVGVAACGGDGGSRCESVMTRFCSMACDCTESDTCVFYAEANGASSTVEFDSKSDCLAFYVNLGCASAGSQEDAFFEACDSALDSAQCVDTGDGTMALQVPDACNTAA